jgi:hypothetical protein
MVDRLGKCVNGIKFKYMSYVDGAVSLSVVVVLTYSVYIKTPVMGCQGLLVSGL